MPLCRVFANWVTFIVLSSAERAEKNFLKAFRFFAICVSVSINGYYSTVYTSWCCMKNIAPFLSLILLHKILYIYNMYYYILLWSLKIWYSRASIIWISIIWSLDYLNAIHILKSQKIWFFAKPSNKWNACVILRLLYHSAVGTKAY